MTTAQAVVSASSVRCDPVRHASITTGIAREKTAHRNLRIEMPPVPVNAFKRRFGPMRFPRPMVTPTSVAGNQQPGKRGERLEPRSLSGWREAADRYSEGS
jgi:hypothetical protein